MLLTSSSSVTTPPLPYALLPLPSLLPLSLPSLCPPPFPVPMPSSLSRSLSRPTYNVLGRAAADRDVNLLRDVRVAQTTRAVRASKQYSENRHSGDHQSSKTRHSPSVQCTFSLGKPPRNPPEFQREFDEISIRNQCGYVARQCRHTLVRSSGALGGNVRRLGAVKETGPIRVLIRTESTRIQGGFDRGKRQSTQQNKPQRSKRRLGSRTGRRRGRRRTHANTRNQGEGSKGA